MTDGTDVAFPTFPVHEKTPALCCPKEQLTSHGVIMQVTAPYAPSQNGKAKRFIHTLEDHIRLPTFLTDSGPSMSFWEVNMTPFEHDTRLDLSHLHVWGCQCIVAMPPELHVKGGPHCFEVKCDNNLLGQRVCDLNVQALMHAVQLCDCLVAK